MHRSRTNRDGSDFVGLAAPIISHFVFGTLNPGPVISNVLLKMILFVIALICASAVLFAGISTAVNDANRIHIENDREPNAGIAFMPDLIVMIGFWWGVGSSLKYFCRVV